MKRRLSCVIFSLSLSVASVAFAGAYEEMEEAMRRHDTPSVIRFIQRGMDINTVDREGETLLIQAVKSDMPDLLDYLLSNRARLNYRNKNGETAVSIAAFMGKKAAVQKIVEAGAALNFYGWPPLIYAAFNGHAEIVDYLLGRGAELDGKSQNGATALYVAVRNGHVDVVKLLLKRGANPSIPNDQGDTALDAAVRMDQEETLALIRAAGGRSGKSLASDASK